MKIGATYNQQLRAYFHGRFRNIASWGTRYSIKEIWYAGFGLGALFVACQFCALIVQACILRHFLGNTHVLTVGEVVSRWLDLDYFAKTGLPFFCLGLVVAHIFALLSRDKSTQ